MIAFVCTTVSSFFLAIVLLTTMLSFAVDDPVPIAALPIIILFLLAGGSVTALTMIVRRLRRIESDEAWYADQIARDRCPACAYDLRERGSDRCPECGLAIAAPEDDGPS